MPPAIFEPLYGDIKFLMNITIYYLFIYYLQIVKTTNVRHFHAVPSLWSNFRHSVTLGPSLRETTITLSPGSRSAATGTCQSANGAVNAPLFLVGH